MKSLEYIFSCIVLAKKNPTVIVVVVVGKENYIGAHVCVVLLGGRVVCSQPAQVNFSN